MKQLLKPSTIGVGQVPSPAAGPRADLPRATLIPLMPIILLALSYNLFAADIQTLQFMAGCWAGPFGDQVNQEMWMAPKAGTMMGTARNVKGQQTTFSEFMFINTEKDQLGMSVQSKLGGEAVRFPVKLLKPGEVVFENPSHDFPRRILYQAKGRNGLFAKIEGTMNGKNVSEQFPMKRVACK